MRKISVFLILILLVALLAACNNKNPSELDTSSPKVTESPMATALRPTTNDNEEDIQSEPVPAIQGKVEIAQDRIPTGFALTKIGEITDRSIRVQCGADYVQMVNIDLPGVGHIVPLNSLCEPLTDVDCISIKTVTPGYYALYKYDSGVNRVALYAEDGTELIPFEAAMIEAQFTTYYLVPTSWLSEARYLRVVYAKEVTDNEDEAVYEDTDAYYWFDGEDAYYKGYYKLYDTVERRFVPDFSATNPDNYCLQVGNELFVYTDEQGKSTVYNADGKSVMDVTDRAVELGNGCFVVDYSTVYDNNGAMLYKFQDTTVSVLGDSGKFLGGASAVFDMYGNKLFDHDPSLLIITESGGFFSGSTATEGMLLDAQGNVVYKSDSAYSPIYKGFGVWMFSSADADAKSFYYMVNGSVVESNSRSSYNMANLGSGNTSLTPWLRPDVTVDAADEFFPLPLDYLVLDISADGDRLVDCFTGETLLTAKNSIDVTANGYVYAKDEVGGTITIYKLELQYK